MTENKQRTRVSVIGAGGMVGSAVAYALVLSGFGGEVLMVDVAEKLVRGQALDVADAAAIFGAKVRVGSSKEAGQSDLVIITAGVPQKPGQTRDELLGINLRIMKSICDSMQPMRTCLRILVISNPVDVLTHFVQQFSGLPKNQVMGSGTFLDSSRLRSELSTLINIDPRDIQAFSIGEHGDRQFAAWSTASIAGSQLVDHPRLKGTNLDEIRETTMKKAYEIIDAKQSTYYGIGAHAARIGNALLSGANSVFPLVHWHEAHSCYMSFPCSIGPCGVEETLNIKLNTEESKRLLEAVEHIKSNVKSAARAFGEK